MVTGTRCGWFSHLYLTGNGQILLLYLELALWFECDQPTCNGLIGPSRVVGVQHLGLYCMCIARRISLWLWLCYVSSNHIAMYSPLVRIGRVDRSSYENVSVHQFPDWYAMVCLFDLIFLAYASNNSTEFGCRIISWQTPPSHLPLLCLIVMQFLGKETSNFPAAMRVHNVLTKNEKSK